MIAPLSKLSEDEWGEFRVSYEACQLAAILMEAYSQTLS